MSVLDKQTAESVAMRVIVDIHRILAGNMKVDLFFTIFYIYLRRRFYYVLFAEIKNP